MAKEVIRRWRLKDVIKVITYEVELKSITKLVWTLH